MPGGVQIFSGCYMPSKSTLLMNKSLKKLLLGYAIKSSFIFPLFFVSFSFLALERGGGGIFALQGGGPPLPLLPTYG